MIADSLSISPAGCRTLAAGPRAAGEPESSARDTGKQIPLFFPRPTELSPVRRAVAAPRIHAQAVLLH
jgi:hypothetical protein